MSADTLRRAAALMRERAEAAVQPVDSPGWIIDRKDRYARPNEVYRGPTGAGDVATAESAKTAEHIASWHPAVAQRAAETLEQHADLHDNYDCTHEPCAALDLARAYLGERP